MRYIIIFLSFILIAESSFSQSDADTKYWILFSDKGQFKSGMNINKGSDAYKKGIENLSVRAVKRRMKVLSEDNLIDFQDLPLNESYLNILKSKGIEIIAKSKWLNGVSAYLNEKKLVEVKNLEFVSQIKVVNKLYKQDNNFIEAKGDLKTNPLQDTADVYDYGNSYKQMKMVNVPKVHNLGITGKGVIIASFDDGFDWKNHESLRNLNVIGEYDFINNDNNTYYEANQKYEDKKNQGQHGTATLSTMSGFKEGKLIGPAFNSGILLAKTEYIPTETPMEEDFWLEAAEWAEAQGTDIITSSLIYKEYDKPFVNNSYSYDNFDGNTAITTIAADRSAYLGIVVCQAMGNYNQTTVPSLGSAADGDSVISVGAVNYSGDPARFTSNGPTKDGRTKPDVAAPGVGVFVAVVKEVSGNESTYEYSNGTSFSTPITAGVAALILSAHPELTPMQIRDALRNTASRSDNPDNVLGWGVINAYDALLYYGMVWSNEFNMERKGDDKFKISTYLASKDVIDPGTVKYHYSYDNGNTYNEILMQQEESSGDGTNSGKYSVELRITDNNENFKSYFSAQDFSGKQFTYPKNEVLISTDY